jgi:uncharacterized protein
MHIAASDNERFLISIPRGEELFAALRQFVSEQSIAGGFFSGLGAADRLELAHYNLATREYERQVLEAEVEILSLHGNVAWKKGQLILHIHGTFGRRDLSTFGGHLFALRVSGAGEIHFTALASRPTRAFDEATGLTTLCPFTAGLDVI